MGNQFFDVLNSFFDHIYVISLKRSEERHLLLNKNLDGLEYELFWGVDGRELNLKELEADNLYHPGLTRLKRKLNGKEPKEMRLPKIGCALTKNLVYKDIIKNDYAKALILEDDILFDKSKDTYIKQALLELPENWDLLYLGYWGNTNPNFIQKVKNSLLSSVSKFLIKYDPIDIKNRYPRKYSMKLDKSGRHFGGHSYAVSKLGAKKILQYSSPITHHGDNILGELCNNEWLNAFNLKQIVAFQNRFLESTLAAKTEMHKLPPSVMANNVLEAKSVQNN